MITLRLCALFFLLLGSLHAAPLAGTRPNVIFILTDDQGYGDLSCHGNPVLKTPNLDRLHAEGARFTDFMVSPTCAPTRAALLTGRHEFRSGITHTILERERLALDAVTLPSLLQRAGYTTGIFGKWHLGDEDDRQPQRRGFDEAYIHGGGGIGQSYPGSCGDAPGNRYDNPVLRHNGTFVKTQGYCTDLYFSQAMKWMEGREGKPFYCHIATNAPHAPLQCPAGYEEKYAGKVSPEMAKFFGMIANIDDNAGKLLEWLKTQPFAENTLVVFMNDNGGTAGCPLFNAGMRATKGTPWRGGTRAASFWRWPGRILPGDRPQLAAHLDFFPTLCALAGVKDLPEIDGKSLLPMLENAQAPAEERTLFTHVGRWEKGKAAESKLQQCAVRSGQFTLVIPDKKSPRWQLFDLSADPGQQKDIAAERPEVVARLAASYDTWWQSVQPGLVNETAELAELNPWHVAYYKQFGGGPARPAVMPGQKR